MIQVNVRSNNPKHNKGGYRIANIEADEDRKLTSDKQITYHV